MAYTKQDLLERLEELDRIAYEMGDPLKDVTWAILGFERKGLGAQFAARVHGTALEFAEDFKDELVEGGSELS
jgi:hypothetical protein